MTSVPRKGLPLWAKWLIYIFIFGAAGVLVWSQLPRGAYPTDLTRVGAGRPALVLAYDIQSLGGMQGMGVLDGLRGEYSDRVEFLVADLGVPDGKSLAQQYDAESGAVMQFSGDGTHVRTMHLPLNSEILRHALEEAVAGQPR